jgi:23S rRNA pseudouridine1911/1915/1917 synthase
MSAVHPVREAALLLPFLFTSLPEVKRTKVRQWLKYGGIKVNGTVARDHARQLQPGDLVELVTIKAPDPQAPKLPAGLRVLHEDAALLVIEKPAGMLSIADKQETRGTVYAHLTDYVRKSRRGRAARVWIVHRLDRETSGLMVFALTREIKQALQENWRSVEKRYLAVVDGLPREPQGTLHCWLDESDPYRVRALRQPEGESREAITEYEVKQTHGQRALVQFKLVTGRRHQIRVQSSRAGWPVLGDGKYHPAAAERERLALHAAGLSLQHPQSGERLQFESDLPFEMKRMLQQG